MSRVERDSSAILDFGVPLLPDEAAAVQERLSTAKAALSAVDGYARRFPEYAGGYVEMARGGVAVVTFTGRLEEHRAAIADLVPADAPLEIETVAWTFDELRALKERVAAEADTGWLESIDAELVSVGIKTDRNLVHVVITSANPEAPGAIIEHFDARGMMYVDSDGIGVGLLPTGVLAVQVVDARGRPVPHVLVACAGDLPNTGTGDIGTSTDANGEWRAELTATGYTCNAIDGDATVGFGRAIVPAGGMAALRMTVLGP